MGETAKRISDGKKIKIGVCNEMMYCRYDQLKDVKYEYRTDNMLWRIPNPDEDGIKPGDFSSQVVTTDYVPWFLTIDIDKIDFTDKADMVRCSGNMQMWDRKSGLSMNIKCYHGLQLPESNKDIQFFWNGKTNPLYLSHLNNTPDELKVCVSCRCCKKTWTFNYNEIAPAIYSLWMKLRLFHQCSDYIHKEAPKALDKLPAPLIIKDYVGREMRLNCEDFDHYSLTRNKKCVAIGYWETVRTALIRELGSAPDYKMMKDRYLPETQGKEEEA